MATCGGRPRRSAQDDLPCVCYLYLRMDAITIPNAVIVRRVDEGPHHTSVGKDEILRSGENDSYTDSFLDSHTDP